MNIISIYNPQGQPRKGVKTTDRGATPAKGGSDGSPEGATEHSATPSGLRWHTRFSRGCTPACNLISPSGFGCIYFHIR